MDGLRLGVNIDHVATLRQARYATMPDSKNVEPDPILALQFASELALAGLLPICALIDATFKTETWSACARPHDQTESRDGQHRGDH